MKFVAIGGLIPEHAHHVMYQTLSTRTSELKLSNKHWESTLNLKSLSLHNNTRALDGSRRRDVRQFYATPSARMLGCFRAFPSGLTGRHADL